MIIASLVATGALTGCSTRPPEESQIKQEQDREQENPENETRLSESKEQTIEIEGMEETVVSYYYNGGIFKTYVPEDLIVENASSGEGDVYWFYANYNNEKKDDVYLQLFFFPETIKEQPQMVGEGGMLTLQGFDGEAVEAENRLKDWSIEEYHGNNGEAYAYLGKHHDRYFVFILRHPGEFAEGFVPRASLVMENLYWSDDKPLEE